MPKDTTTLRMSRRTHQVLRAVAAHQGRTVTELLDEWVERARREQVLQEYAERMAELADDLEQSAGLEEDRAWLDAAAGATLADEPPYPLP
jgi:phosphopantetheine adenylyltransferase